MVGWISPKSCHSFLYETIAEICVSVFAFVALIWFWHKPISSDRFQSQILFICSFSLVLPFFSCSFFGRIGLKVAFTSFSLLPFTRFETIQKSVVSRPEHVFISQNNPFSLSFYSSTSIDNYLLFYIALENKAFLLIFVYCVL